MTQITKAFVLLSGGVDSTTNVGLAVNAWGAENVEAVSVDYGQRHLKEIASAEAVCSHYGIKHTVLKMSQQPESMLTNASAEVPSISYSDIKGVSPTYVFFRNGQLLSLIAAHAHSVIEGLNKVTDAASMGLGDMYDGVIYFGAHAEDAAGWAYPDCTPEFIGAMANAIYIGTYFKVRLLTPLAFMNKTQVVTTGMALDVPYDLTWSCYKGEEYHCGECPTCRARHEAFCRAGVSDPTTYRVHPPVGFDSKAKVVVFDGDDDQVPY